MAGNGSTAQALTPGSTSEVGPILRYEVRYAGRNLLLPIRGIAQGVVTVRQILLDEGVNPDLPMFTCRVNGATLVITLRDLKMAP